jgi:hypothetical protein
MSESAGAKHLYQGVFTALACLVHVAGNHVPPHVCSLTDTCLYGDNDISSPGGCPHICLHLLLLDTNSQHMTG